MNDHHLWDGDIADGTEFGLWVAATGAFSREGAFFLLAIPTEPIRKYPPAEPELKNLNFAVEIHPPREKCIPHVKCREKCRSPGTLIISRCHSLKIQYAGETNRCFYKSLK
jgi:hypothetical protein